MAQQFGAYGNFLLEAAKTNGVEFPKRYQEPSAEDLERMEGLGYFGGAEPDAPAAAPDDPPSDDAGD